MKFELNHKEQKKAEEFKDMCHLIEGYVAFSVDRKRALTFKYVFECSSSTLSSAIECNELEIGINLTDYSGY